MPRVMVYLLGGGLLALMVWPTTWAREDGDSFPHSTFPMFASARPRQMVLTHALGVAGESRVPLEPLISSGSRGVLQSEKFIRRGVQNDAAAYCAQVAARVREHRDDGDEALVGVTAVELVSSRFDVLAYFESEAGRAPLERAVHVRCEVEAP